MTGAILWHLGLSRPLGGVARLADSNARGRPAALPVGGRGAREILYALCCGLEVHKDRSTACLRRLGGGGHVTQELRPFGTTTGALLALLDWQVRVEVPGRLPWAISLG